MFAGMELALAALNGLMAKPRIKKSRHGFWVCALGEHDLGAYVARTPSDAYRGWAAIRK